MSWHQLWSRKWDLSVGAFGILLGIVILVIDATGTPPPSLSNVGLGPAAVPNAIAVLSILLSLAVLAQAARPPHHPATEHPEPDHAADEIPDAAPAMDDDADDKDVISSPREEFLHLLRLSVLFVAYLIAMTYAGFVVSTIVFLIVFYRMLRAAGWLKSIVIAVLFTVALYYVFAELFSIQLPASTLKMLGW